MESSQNIPGEFHCPSCSFVLVRRRMDANTGAISADPDAESPVCPQCQSLMGPMSWERGCLEAREMAVTMGNRLDITHQFATVLVEVLLAFCDDAEANGRGDELRQSLCTAYEKAKGAGMTPVPNLEK